MPVIRFEEVSRDTATGLLYLIVNAWATRQAFNQNRPPLLTNDFLMQIPRLTRQVRLDSATGWPLLAPEPGVPLDPSLRVRGTAYDFLFDEVLMDVRGVVRTNVRAWLTRATGRGDRGDQRVDISRPRDTDDPDGILAEAVSLVGTDENT